jgi:hypothetical protein
VLLEGDWSPSVLCLQARRSGGSSVSSFGAYLAASFLYASSELILAAA